MCPRGSRAPWSRPAVAESTVLRAWGLGVGPCGHEPARANQLARPLDVRRQASDRVPLLGWPPRPRRSTPPAPGAGRRGSARAPGGAPPARRPGPARDCRAGVRACPRRAPRRPGSPPAQRRRRSRARTRARRASGSRPHRPTTALCSATSPPCPRPGSGESCSGRLEKRVSSSRCSRFSASARHLREGDRDGIEVERERLRVEVAAGVEALGLIAVGLQVERAVGNRSQLALQLMHEVVELVVCGPVDLRQNAQGDGRLRAVPRWCVAPPTGQPGVHPRLARIALEPPDAR